MAATLYLMLGVICLSFQQLGRGPTEVQLVIDPSLVGVEHYSTILQNSIESPHYPSMSLRERNIESSMYSSNFNLLRVWGREYQIETMIIIIAMIMITTTTNKLINNKRRKLHVTSDRLLFSTTADYSVKEASKRNFCDVASI